MDNPSVCATVIWKLFKSVIALYLSVIKRTCNQGANKSNHPNQNPLFSSHVALYSWQYCPLAPAVVYVVHGNVATAPCAMYVKGHCERCNLTNAMSHLTLPVHSAHHVCCGQPVHLFAETAVCPCIHMYVGSAGILMLVFFWCTSCHIYCKHCSWSAYWCTSH
jgi:hypothetical protein